MSSALLRYHRRSSNWQAAVCEGLQFARTIEMCERYVGMRLAGESRKLAAMLALQQGPALRTDSEFKKGHVNGNQFESCPVVGDHHRRLAERAGVSTAGKVYLRGLARYPGDPVAWVSGRADVQKVAEDRGWGVQGSVNVARREVEPAPDVKVGMDIVAQAAVELRQKDPGLSREESLHKAVQMRSGSGEDPLRVSWPQGEGAEQSREIMP
jgi:hypothetical protein